MSNRKLSYRQVHLDFHTSGACEDVGAAFDAQQFAETVKAGHIDAMTIFAKCHHGYSYYPTRVGVAHPHLKFDLMGAQIEALHSIDVRTPIYISVMWDEVAGEQHPEWIIVDKQGKRLTRSPLWGTNQWPPSMGGEGWTTLDVSTAYSDYIFAQVEEICTSYSVDGFFFDICLTIPNYSAWSLSEMKAAGVSPVSDQAVWYYTEDKLLRFYKRVRSLIRSIAPEATVFFNGSVNPRSLYTAPYQTHFEVESLPTSGTWGYLNYPVEVRHARTLGIDYAGMTGRFHKSWADFGGLKTSVQLQHEYGVILSGGGRISVGDQLHPNGALDPAVYRLLATAYSRVEQLEPWLIAASPTAEIAILHANRSETQSPFTVPAYGPDVEGAAQMLLEMAVQFDIVDAEVFDPQSNSYRALLLPDDFVVDASLAEKLQLFVVLGGKLILSGTSGLDMTTGLFVAGVPVRYLAPCPTIPAYLHLQNDLVADSELSADYKYAFYDQGQVVRPMDGATAYGNLHRALFNRTWEHFTSHAHAPVGESMNSPLVIYNDHVLYFAVPLFRAYRNHDYWIYRQLVATMLMKYLPEPLISTNAPSWIEVTLHKQPVGDGERHIVHLTAYQPRRTFQTIAHMDQSALTSGIYVRVLCKVEPRRVYIAPNEQELSFTIEGKYAHVELPSIGVHTVLVLE